MRKGENWIRKVETIALIGVALLVLLAFLLNRVHGS